MFRHPGGGSATLRALALVPVHLPQGGPHAPGRATDHARAATQDDLSPLFPGAVRAMGRGPAAVPAVPGPADRSPPRTVPTRDPAGLPHEGPLHLPQNRLEAPADRSPRRPELPSPKTSVTPGRLRPEGSKTPWFLRTIEVTHDPQPFAPRRFSSERQSPAPGPTTPAPNPPPAPTPARRRTRPAHDDRLSHPLPGRR